MMVQLGTKVVRGPDWNYDDHDGGVGHIGTVIQVEPSTNYSPAMVQVKWDNGNTYLYRCGPNPGSCNLRVRSS